MERQFEFPPSWLTRGVGSMCCEMAVRGFADRHGTSLGVSATLMKVRLVLVIFIGVISVASLIYVVSSSTRDSREVCRVNTCTILRIQTITWQKMLDTLKNGAEPQ